MLTLDEPDSQSDYGHMALTATWAAGDVLPIEHLFMTVRAWCDHASGGQVAGDPDPLYRTHGDPRD